MTLDKTIFTKRSETTIENNFHQHKIIYENDLFDQEINYDKIVLE